MEEEENIIIRAESDWHYSKTEAELECDSRLASLESEAVSEAESRGGRYIGSDGGGYEVVFDSLDNKYMCSREMTIMFVYDSQKINFSEEIEILPPENFTELISYSGNQEPPIDITKHLLSLVTPIAPKKQEFEFYVFSRLKRYAFDLTIIKFEELKLTESNLMLNKDAYTLNIPQSENIIHIPYSNCGSSNQSLKREISYRVTKGWRIDFTKKITSSSRLGGKLKFGGVGEASFEQTLSTSITNHKSISETREETIRTTYNFNINANKKVDIKLTVQNFEARRKFSGPITIDGKVIFGYSDNGAFKKVKKLSDILTKSQRTIEISGEYVNINWEEIPIEIFETDCK